MPERRVVTEHAPAPAGPYSQARIHGDLLFLAGQGPFDTEGTLAGPDIESQTRQVLTNLEAVCAAAGTSLVHAVRVGVFLKTMDDFDGMNSVYASYFEEPFPARTTVQSDLRGMLVEIDAVVSLGTV
ncbi:MAG: Rid family detoxifying hydrolase [Actinomycetota bacterium]